MILVDPKINKPIKRQEKKNQQIELLKLQPLLRANFDSAGFLKC